MIIFVFTLSNRASRFLLVVVALSCAAFCLAGGPQAMAAARPSSHQRQVHAHAPAKHVVRARKSVRVRKGAQSAAHTRKNAHVGKSAHADKNRQMHAPAHSAHKKNVRARKNVHTSKRGHAKRAHHKRAHHKSKPLNWKLSIPAIGVSATVIRLGGPRVGRISVPSFSKVWDVGWYRYGAVPGNRGNALLLGHVDTYQGPAVFYDLYALRPGDIVRVRIGHGRTRQFKVHWVKEVLKSHFPAKRILGSTRGKHLWLVTCGGQFDYSTRSYLSNIVVYTTPVQPHRHPAAKRR